MSTTQFPRLLKRAFTQLAPTSGHVETLVWRRITRADCRAPRGRMPSADLLNRILDKLFTIGTWQVLGETVLARSRVAPDRPVLVAREPVELAPPPPPLRPMPGFRDRYPDLQWEDETIEGRTPVSFRTYYANYTMYHPKHQPPIDASIFYIPPPTHALSPAPEQIISLLSLMTGAKIITPLPSAAAFQPFPHSLYNLLRIHDCCSERSAKTAVLSAGMSAPLATAIAMTESAVSALGLWGGVLDLTMNAETATAWNRTEERWDHYSPPLHQHQHQHQHPSTAPPAADTSLFAITNAQFWELRRRHFPNPETWTDPFASPQLFFRSAPVEFSRLTLKEIWGNDAFAAGNRDRILAGIEELEAHAEEGLSSSFVYPRRQSRLPQEFPPEGREKPFPKMRLVLPAVAEGEDDVVWTQGAAFAEVVRANLRRWFDAQRRDIHVEDAMEIADAKILFGRMGTKDEMWEAEVGNMAHWLRWVLEQDNEF